MRINTSAALRLQAMPQKSKFWLYVQKATWVWQGRVDGVFPYGAGYNIHYTTFAGNPAMIHSGLTAWFGTDFDDKAKSRGQARIIKTNPGYLTVGPNAGNIPVGSIVSVDRVPRFYPINGSHDGGEVLGAQHEWGPYTNIGPHRVGWSGAPIAFYASNSWTQRGRTVASYAWDFEGASDVRFPENDQVGSPNTPIIARWDVPGDYMVSLTITDNTGAFHTARRVVMVRNVPDQKDTLTTPYTKFDVESLGGNWSDGGWQARITVYGAADASSFPDGAVVVLTADDEFDSVPYQFGGIRWFENYLMVGYITNTTVTAEGDSTYTVSFEVNSAHVVARELGLFPINLAPANAATAAHNIDQVTLTEAAHHILTQHTTLSQWFDFAHPYDLDRRVDYLDIPESNLWDILGNDIGPARLASPYFDRYGTLHIETNANYRHLAQRASYGPPEATLDTAFWMQIDLGTENTRTKVCQVDGVGGYIHTLSAASSTNLTSVFSLYPATQTQPGTVEKVDTLLVPAASQAQAEQELATWTQMVYAQRNLRFPDVTVRCANVRAWDIDQPYVGIKLNLADTNRGWIWTNKEFIVRRVDYEVNTEFGYMLVTYGLEESVWGEPGVAGEFPPGSPGPEYRPELIGYGTDNRTGQNLLMCSRFNVFLSEDIWAGPDIVWQDRTGDLAPYLGRASGGGSPRLNGVERDPYYPGNRWWAWGHIGIWRSDDSGATWDQYLTPNQFSTWWNTHQNPVSASEMATWAVIRHVSPPEPRYRHGALVVARHPTLPGFSRLWFIRTDNDWQTIADGYYLGEVRDPDNYSAANLAHLSMSPWPSRQDSGRQVCYVTAEYASQETVMLWISWDGGSNWSTAVHGDALGYKGTAPARVFIPTINNSQADKAYWVGAGQRGGSEWYTITGAAAGTLPLTIVRGPGAPPVIGPGFGVLHDCGFHEALDGTKAAAGYINSPGFWTCEPNVTTWTTRAAPPNGGLMYSGFAGLAHNSDIYYIGCQLPRENASVGRVWATNNRGASWKDITGNLPLLQNETTTQFRALWCLSPHPSI